MIPHDKLHVRVTSSIFWSLIWNCPSLSDQVFFISCGSLTISFTSHLQQQVYWSNLDRKPFFVLVPDVVCIYDTEWPQTLAEHKSLLQKSHVFACLWLWSYESHDLKQCVIYSPTATTSSTGSSLAVSHQSVLLQSVLGLVFYCYMDHVRKWLTTSYQLVVSAYISYNLFTEWIMGLQPRSFGSRGKCFTTGLPVIC